MSALNYEFLVQPTRMEGKNLCCKMCHNMCHKRTMQSLCVSTFVTFVRRRGVERQQKETLFLSEDEEKFSREVGAWSWKIFFFSATIFYH